MTIHGWHELSSKPERLICRSSVHTLREHYLDSHRRSCKCPGEACSLCEYYPCVTSGVIAVTREYGAQLRLLRITPAAWKEALESGLVDELGPGLLLECCTIGRGKQEGIEIRALGREPAREVFISKYVDAIGKRAYEKTSGLLQANQPLSVALA